MKGCESETKKSSNTYRYVATKIKIKELLMILDTVNYLHTFSPVTAEVTESLKKFTPMKSDWTWNRMYMDLYDRAKEGNQKDACIKCYNAARPIYLKIDASGIGLGVRFLQVRNGMNWGHDKVQIM